MGFGQQRGTWEPRTKKGEEEKALSIPRVMQLSTQLSLSKHLLGAKLCATTFAFPSWIFPVRLQGSNGWLSCTDNKTRPVK